MTTVERGDATLRLAAGHNDTCPAWSSTMVCSCGHDDLAEVLKEFES